MSELKQLKKYMESLEITKGILVCPKSSLPKRKNGRNVYIENLSLFITTEEAIRGRSINLMNFLNS
jgi:hypothetical protein